MDCTQSLTRSPSNWHVMVRVTQNFYVSGALPVWFRMGQVWEVSRSLECFADVGPELQLSFWMSVQK